MGTFITSDTTPTVFPDGDKSAAPGIARRPGWTTDNVLSAAECNTIKDALLDCRTAIRANGLYSPVVGAISIFGATTDAAVLFSDYGYDDQPDTNYYVFVTSLLGTGGATAALVYVTNVETTGFTLRAASIPGSGKSFLVQWWVLRV